MAWKLIIIFVSLSACASTVWKNDQEAPPKPYSDRLVNYDIRNEVVRINLKKHISEKLLELIDHSNNAANESYAPSLRQFSKEKVKTMLNIGENNKGSKEVDEAINRVRKSSLKHFLIQNPELNKDSTIYSKISLEGKDFIKARIRRRQKLFLPDTVTVWEVEFVYLGLKDSDLMRTL